MNIAYAGCVFSQFAFGRIVSVIVVLRRCARFSYLKQQWVDYDPHATPHMAFKKSSSRHMCPGRVHTCQTTRL